MDKVEKEEDNTREFIRLMQKLDNKQQIGLYIMLSGLNELSGSDN